MDFNLKFDKRQTDRLEKMAIIYKKGSIDQHLSVVINRAARKTRTATSSPVGISQDIRKFLNVKSKFLNKWLTIPKKYRANRNKLNTRVILLNEGRPSLGHFGARSTQKGVTYKIMKNGKRGFIPSAFGPPGGNKKNPDGIQRLGFQVWRREEGAPRLPIRKLWGLSPAAWVRKNKRSKLHGKIAAKRMDMELKERIRFIKKTGWGSKRIKARKRR